MAKGNDPHSEMACARQTDGINVIFDKNSPASSPSRRESSCESDRSSESVHHMGRDSSLRHRSSSSSSSRSPRSRSRSHPRCHRPSSRCRCDNHFRYGRARHPNSRRRSSSRSRSCSRSPLPNSDSRRRHNRSRSRSLRRWSRYNRTAGHSLKSSSRTDRSRSRSSEHSDSLSLDVKRELLKAAYANSTKILGVDHLDLPESVKPILSERWESKPVWQEPGTRVTQNPIKSLAQSDEEEPEDVPSPKLSQKGKISFSINNSVVKPTVVALSCAKVTPRMDSYESRKPYGHWVPVKSGKTSKARKHHLAKSR